MSFLICYLTEVFQLEPYDTQLPWASSCFVMRTRGHLYSRRPLFEEFFVVFLPLVRKSSLLQRVIQSPQTAFPQSDHSSCAQRQINANQPQALTMSQSAVGRQMKSRLLFLCKLVFKGWLYLRGW